MIFSIFFNTEKLFKWQRNKNWYWVFPYLTLAVARGSCEKQVRALAQWFSNSLNPPKISSPEVISRNFQKKKEKRNQYTVS